MFCHVFCLVPCLPITSQVGHTDWLCKCLKPDFQDSGFNFDALGLQFGGFRALVAPLRNPDLNLSFLFPALGAIEGAMRRPTATPDHKKHGKANQKC